MKDTFLKNLFSNPSKTHQTYLGLFMAISTGLLWSVLAIALKYSLNFASPGNIVWMRLFVAFFVLGIWFLLKAPKQLSIFKAFPKAPLLAGLLIAGNYFGFMKGVQLTSASNAQIMIQMAPMSLILIGIFYFKERPSIPQSLGILVAISGFGFFFWDQISLVSGNVGKYLTGNTWLIGAALAWALFATIQKVSLPKWKPQQFNLFMYAVASLALLPMADFSELRLLETWQTGFLILLGLNTILAYGALGEALKRIPASHVGMIITANPLLTILFINIITYYELNWIRPEPIDWRGYLGALLVFLGVALAVSKSRSKT